MGRHGMGRPGVFRRRLGRAQRRDSGMSLVELVVTMSIMGIFLAIFTGAMLSMYNSTNKVQGVTDTSSQLSTAMSRLDSSVRYAAAISPPVTGTDGNAYVAWQSTYTGATVCTQLRVNASASQLQQRTWTVSGASATGLTSWTPLASQIVAKDPSTGAALVPFTFIAATGSVPNQQLQVALVAVEGSGSQQTVTRRTVTFTAFNTTPATTTSGICQEVGSP